MANFLENVIEKMIRDGIVTESELQAKIEEERAKSPITKLSENDEVLMIGLADAYETQMVNDAVREEENTASLLALSEAYELILQLQARIELLEGGNK